MEITRTTPAGRGTERKSTIRIAGRFDHPVLTGAIALVGWLVFVLIRLEVWGKGQISYFIGIGVVFAKALALPPGVQQVLRAGYDGQFYYRLALDPFNWHLTAYGITMDEPYRYTRIGWECPRICVGTNERDVHAFDYYRSREVPPASPWL